MPNTDESQLVDLLSNVDTIVLDCAIAQLKHADKFWAFFGFLRRAKGKKIIVTYEDTLPRDCFQNAEASLPISCFVRKEFIALLKDLSGKKCVFVFALDISKYNINLLAHYLVANKANYLALLARDEGEVGVLRAKINGKGVAFSLPNALENDAQTIKEKPKEPVDQPTKNVLASPDTSAESLRSEKIKPDGTKKATPQPASHDDTLPKTSLMFSRFSPREKAPQKEPVEMPDYRKLFKDSFGTGLIDKVGVFKTGKGEDIVLVSNIGKDGGESVVYTIRFTNNKACTMIAKMLRPNKITKNKQQKIERMLKKPIRDRSIAWPLDSVLYKGQIVGYVREDAGNTNLKNYLVQLEKDGRPKSELISALIMVCEIIQRVHGLGLVIGDLKPENFRMDCKNGKYNLETLSLIDTDSLQIEEFTAPMVTPPFASPQLFGFQELHRNDIVYLPVEADYFALSVLLLKAFVGFSVAPYFSDCEIDPGDMMDECRKAWKTWFKCDSFIFSNVSNAATAKKVQNRFQRACWAHLPSPIKDAFCSAFNKVIDKKALSGGQWVELLRAYLKALADGSLRALDPKCNVLRFSTLKEADAESLFSYKKVDTHFDASQEESARPSLSPEEEPAESNSSSVSVLPYSDEFKVCAFDLEDLVVKLCKQCSLELSDDEVTRAACDLDEDLQARIDSFKISLIANVGIVVEGKIEKASNL